MLSLGLIKLLNHFDYDYRLKSCRVERCNFEYLLTEMQYDIHNYAFSGL